jgi:hypothetical protein
MLIDITKHINKPITGIIQVGAHIGGELQTLKELSDNILMFEPQKNIFEQLLNNIKDEPSIIAENIALGSSAGKLKMYKEHSNGGQSSSLMMPALHTIQYPGIVFTDTEEVEVKTLDCYMEGKSNKYNIMMLDVQGYELEVLKGATETLKTIEYILCEVNRAELYRGCPMVDEIDSHLSKFGFKRDVTSWDGYTWGDALYVKDNANETNNL